MEGVLNQLFAIIYLRGMDDCPSVLCYLDISSAVRIICSVSAPHTADTHTHHTAHTPSCSVRVSCAGAGRAV